jgi:hypothetical protein
MSENPDLVEKTVVLNKDTNCSSDEVSEWNEEHIITYGRENHYCCKVIKNLAELVSIVWWKQEFLSEELVYLVRLIFKHGGYSCWL